MSKTDMLKEMAIARKIIAKRMKQLFAKGCHKILLIAPPESPERNFNIELVLSKRYPCFPPYGCGILARQIKFHGYKPEIIDLNFHLLHMVYEDLANFNYRIWQKKLAEKIQAFQPDFIGISVMFTIAHKSMVEVCQFIKKKHPGIPIIVGGVYVSNDLENVLRACPDIDFGIFYEGDVAFPDFIDVINGKLPIEKISQIAILENNEFVSTKERVRPDLSNLNTQPDYLDLPIGDYSKYGSLGAYNFLRGDRQAGTAQSNRGSRGRCTFCSVRKFNGLGVRARDVKSVVDEIQFLYETYGITHIMWLDDDLFYKEKRAINLFNEIVKRNLKITWDASNGVIASAITPGLLAAVAESGCIGLHLGIESGNPEILKTIRKPGTVKHFRRAKELLDQYPQIFVKGFLIIGFPNETLGQMMDTVNLARELEFHWYPLQHLSPLPNTDITLSMIEQGLISEKDVSPRFQGGTAGSKSAGGGSLRQRELSEKRIAKHFENIFEMRNLDYVPNSHESSDLWFVVDYKINYEKLLHINHPIKVFNIAKMLRQITDEYTVENSMGNLFMAVLEQKLGHHEEGKRRLALAEQYLKESAYWRKRYEVLGMYQIVEQIRNHVFLSCR